MVPSPPPVTKLCWDLAATDMMLPNSALNANSAVEAKGKRKRGKSSEEIERQRMIHIAVERNRRKQMNEHLQILRSLMPTYYANRGDQASIVGAAIEFVRELQQLVECLESVKRQEAAAESKSWLADVEVRLSASGLFGFIKIVSTRRRGHLISIVAALDHLHLHILQTNITTILQDVVCSFTVKMSGEAMLTAEDIANSIQHILMNNS